MGQQIDLHAEPYCYMSAKDKEAVRDAIRRNFNFPRYRVCIYSCAYGKFYTCERFFTPAQFRAITGAPFPECANEIRCSRLIAIWNKAASHCHYELVRN